MNIYPCGTKVTFCKVEGTITAVTIRFELVSYEISYFDPNTGMFYETWRHESEFTAREICHSDAKKSKIGFK